MTSPDHHDEAPRAHDPRPQAPRPQDPGLALPAHFREKDPLTDTAGVSWAGRDYTVSPYPTDDGATPPALAAALAAVRAGEDPDRRALVAALASVRVLVPIMATSTERGETAHGLQGDNRADMAMVSISAPDGTRTLPVFSSVAALASWQAQARPVPVVTAQAAQAAVQEGCTALVLDPGPDAILLQRSILWALGQGRAWIPPHEDPEVIGELAALAESVPGVLSLVPRPDPAREVDLRAHLVPGLTPEQVRQILAVLGAALSRSQLVAERVSSMKISLEG